MDYMSYIRAIRSSDLPSHAKITAIMIASHFDFTKGDAAWPSNSTLARETGLSVRTVIRAKKILSDRQYLVSHRQFNNVCLYIPNVPVAEGLCPDGNLNTHINTHINTQRNTQRKEKDSNESFVPTNNLEQGEVFFEVVKEQSSPPAAALTQEQADWLLSW